MESSARPPGLHGYLPIADAIRMLGVPRRQLLGRIRGTDLEMLLYAPSRGGWLLPTELVDRIAEESGVGATTGRAETA